MRHHADPLVIWRDLRVICIINSLVEILFRFFLLPTLITDDDGKKDLHLPHLRRRNEEIRGPHGQCASADGPKEGKGQSIFLLN